jgi:type I site-specific restriction-modification system R (restriction) subunit
MATVAAWGSSSKAYIDKFLREHTLLRAVARVNRTATGKKVGLIVDYVGLTSTSGKQ